MATGARLLTVTLLLAVACGPPSLSEDQSPLGWQGTTVQEGSTLTVRTTGGSVWPGDGTLVEEVSIGSDTRGEKCLLGQVYGLDATADRIFILDRVFTTVRVYDQAGNHLMDIGQKGQGPGEMRSPTDMGVDPVRELLIVRESTGALHRFTLEGEYVDTLRPRLRGALSGRSLLLRVTRDGTVIVPHHSLELTLESGRRDTFANVLHTIDDAGGIVEKRPVPLHEHETFILTATVSREAYRPQPVPFGPQEVWSIGWDGAVITGYAAEYRFEIHYADGRRTVIERQVDPVRVHPQEAEAARRQTFGIMRDFQPGWVWNGPEIPETKPFYHAIYPDRSGRLWVLRAGEGRRVENWTEPEGGWRDWQQNPEWGQDGWFEVFEEATGRYLGRVDMSASFGGALEPVIDGDSFIALGSDEAGNPVVRRFRLEFPGG